MSDYLSDTYQNEVPDREDQLDQDQLQPYHNLEDRGVADALDEGYSPPERPSMLIREGDSPTLDDRLAAEEPEPDPYAEVDQEVLDDGEVGGERAGRLMDTNAGLGADTEKDLVGVDVGIDAGAASAEEAAMHIVPDDQY